MSHHQYEEQKNKSHNLFKKVAIATVTFSTLVFGTALAAESQISKVYHVYIDGERIGTVDNKNLIDSTIKNKIDEVQDKYKGLTLTTDTLSVVEEPVFRASTNNSKTLEVLESEISIAAEASVIAIDGKPVAYLKDETEAERTLKLLKLQYVTHEDLAAIEERKNSTSSLPALAEGQSRILDVTFAEKVSIIEGKISPDQILSSDDAAKLLQKGTLEEKKYKVKSGDVLGSIAVAHGLSTKQLLELNPSITEETLLQIDQELNVTAYKSFVNVLVKMEQNKKEAIAHEVQVRESADMYKGDKKVTQEGRDGERIVNYAVELVNGQVTKKTVLSEKITKEPLNHIVYKGTKVVPSRGTGSLSWPTNGGYISSHVGYRWGRLHKGLDIARPSNRTIKAADNGVVVEAGYDGSFGNKIVINHNNGMRTLYAHMSSLTASVGQTVSKGQQIGVMGSTGRSTGMHLHFEVYKNGSLKNPLDYLR